LIGPAEDSEPSGGRYQDKLYLDGDANPTWAGLRIESQKLRTVASEMMPSSQPSEVGGRPTDGERVIAEARRRLERGDRFSSQTAFARELRKWLDQQPDAVRDSQNEVMRIDTIKDHVHPVWVTYRKK